MNRPFYALLILQVTNLWGLYFLISVGPKYIYEALGLNLKSSAFLAALPNLARAITGIIFGEFGDWFFSKGWVSRTVYRKIFVVICKNNFLEEIIVNIVMYILAHICAGLCLWLIIMVKCNYVLAVSFLVLSMMFNGACTVTTLSNFHDLSPNFSGSIFGFANGIASPVGSIVTLVVAAFTKENVSAN